MEAFSLEKPEIKRQLDLFVPSRREWILFGILLLLSIIIRGPSIFSLTFQTDDYAVLGVKSWISWADTAWLSWEGRSFGRIVSVLADRLGGGLLGAAGLYAFTLNLSLIVFSLAVLRFWQAQSSSMIVQLIAAATIIFFPYNSELFSYRFASLLYAVSWMLAACALLMRPKTLFAHGIMLILLIFSFATFQVVAAWIAVAIIFAIIQFLFFPPANVADEKINKTQLDWFNAIKSIICVSASALIIYLIFAKLLIAMFPPIKEDRTSLLALHNIPERMQDLWQYFIYTIRWDFFIPEITRFVMYLLLFFLIVNIIIKNRNLSFFGGFCGYSIQVFNIFSLLSLLVLGWFASVALVLIVEIFYPAPRSVSAFGVWWGGVFYFAFIGVKSRAVNYMLMALCLLVLTSFMLVSNRSQFDQLRINSWDRLLASRILSRMETQPNYSDVQRLAIVGDWEYPIKLATQRWNMNASGFSEEWSRVPLFVEISGLPFQKASSEEMKEAERVAATMPHWPHQGCICVIGEVLVVNFKNNL